MENYTPKNDEPTILVHINFDTDSAHEQEYIAELRELTLSVGNLSPIQIIKANRKAPDAKYFVGTGKLTTILEAVTSTQATHVIFNHTLTPAQKRNLERFLKCKVMDRTQLILDIFAKRAKTFEGKLQVELARLDYASTHLVRGWTHLERQKGGIGLRGGPGEKQLEVDRRLLRVRMKSIKQQLEKVKQQRALSRRARKTATINTVSLIGYTNAGKSTLFNKLTHAEVYAADQLFATLDPTLRRIHIPEIGTIILADTVGFIRNLPHHLVNAFGATLEETVQANLLLHVVDASHADRQHYIEQVNAVVKQIGAEDVPQLQVYNKSDLLPDTPAKIDRDREGRPTRVWLSATTGEGITLLKEALAELLLKPLDTQC
ncbi:MAG: hflX [Gammaproteobacteria bacterium]|nr:hflX [Gammaproteobacteria bacterium]